MPPGYPSPEYFNQFQDLLENLSTLPGELCILGDFNLHVDTTSYQSETFGDLLSSFGLKQHVNFATQNYTVIGWT